MNKLSHCAPLLCAVLAIFTVLSIRGFAKTTLGVEMTTEATNKTNIQQKETTKHLTVKVKKFKVKYKKTMFVKKKQKIKVSKIKPTNADNKNIKLFNKSKKVLKIKGFKIKALKTGKGKVIVKSLDNGYKKTIKIKVKKPYPKCCGVKLRYNKRYHITSNPLNTSMGVKYYKGRRETYYSQRVLPGGGLKIPGRHVADDGTIRDKDGYIVVSCDRSFKSYHSTFLTSLGPAKVYDTGCNYGTVDIYCNW